MKEEKKIEKDVILINKMCTGSYTINNIGHEIINYFKANDENVYIYISPYGSMDKKYDNRIKTIFLTSALSNHKIEIIAKIDNPEQEILFKESNKKESIQIHKEQVEKYQNVLYGGKNLEEIFVNNYKNQESIHITFKTKAKNMKKPKKGMHIFIVNEKYYYIYKNKNDENCIYIPIKEEIASSSLKQYFEKIRNSKSYNEIGKYLKDIYWENFNPEEITDKSIENDEKINFLQLIEKEDEEQIYTNMIWYWFSRENIFNKFLEFIKLDKLIDNYDINKEKVVKGGRTDILALGEKNIIVIENKILSGINGREEDKNDNVLKTQLSKYIIGIKKKQSDLEFFKKEEKDKNKKDERVIKGLIFIPDYRNSDFNVEIDNIKKESKYEKEYIKNYYDIILYSKLYDFFKQDSIKNIMLEDLYGKKYYNDFLNALEVQKQNNISDKNKIEMKRKFIYAIKQARDNKKQN